MRAHLNMIELLARVANNASDPIIIDKAIWHLCRLAKALK